MQRDETQSKKGMYDVYYQDGKKLIVLEGLDPEQQISPPLLQKKIHEHYDAIAALYWILFAGVFGYVVVQYIVRPLIRKWQSARLKSFVS